MQRIILHYPVRNIRQQSSLVNPGKNTGYEVNSQPVSGAGIGYPLYICRTGMAISIYNKLRRITSNQLYFPEIDGIRFLAIILVILFHAHGYFLA